MLGLELSFQDKIISGSVPEGVTTIIVSSLKKDEEDSIHLDFRGLDTASPEIQEQIKWFESELNEGDEMTIRIKDVLQNSTPIETKKPNQVLDDEQKIQQYNRLKKELEEKGLI